MLFSRYLIQNTHQLPIQSFTQALRWMEVEEIDNDETACIIANLICDVSGTFICYQRLQKTLQQKSEKHQINAVIVNFINE